MAHLFSERLRPARPLAWMCAAVCLALVAGGCGEDEEAKRDAQAKKAAAEKAKTQGLRKRHGNLGDAEPTEAVDLNKDQQPDQWVYPMADGKVRVERDMNFDGKIDVWQYQTADGDLVEEEMDLDLDGRVDLVAFYEQGKIRRKELSVNFDDDFSIVKFYSDQGKLLRVERDQDQDGQTDLWEYYDDSGNRERVAWDESGDGQPDTFDNLP